MALFSVVRDDNAKRTDLLQEEEGGKDRPLTGVKGQTFFRPSFRAPMLDAQNGAKWTDLLRANGSDLLRGCEAGFAWFLCMREFYYGTGRLWFCTHRR